MRFYNTNTVTKFLGSRHTAIIDAAHSADYALDIMKRENTDALGVQAFGRFAGILTLADFTRRVIRKDVKPALRIVNEVMTPDPVAIGPSVTLENAYKVMLDNEISHLPVLSSDDSTFLGIISEKDLRNEINFLSLYQVLQNDSRFYSLSSGAGNSRIKALPSFAASRLRVPP